MRYISNTSGELLTNTSGDLLQAQRDSLYDTQSVFEASLRFFTENRRREMVGLSGAITYLKENQIYTPFNLFFILPTNAAESLKEWKGGASMTASGSYTFSSLGISGGGTEEFDTLINPSTKITDINNWAFGVYSQTDNDTGSDFGCHDTTNFHYIKCKTGGEFIVKNGEVEVNAGTVDNGKGHFACVTTAGVVHAYLDGVSQASDNVSGSLANYNMYLGALNGAGSAEENSSKTYSLAWTYDGALTPTQMTQVDRMVKAVNDIYNRRV